MAKADLPFTQHVIFPALTVIFGILSAYFEVLVVIVVAVMKEVESRKS